MNGKRTKVARWLLGVVIVAELAVVDYCVVMLLRNGVTIEVISEEGE